MTYDINKVVKLFLMFWRMVEIKKQEENQVPENMKFVGEWCDYEGAPATRHYKEV